MNAAEIQLISGHLAETLADLEREMPGVSTYTATVRVKKHNGYFYDVTRDFEGNITVQRVGHHS